jgi:hypothetical protein
MVSLGKFPIVGYLVVTSSGSNFDSKHIFPSEEFVLSATEKFVSGETLPI